MFSLQPPMLAFAAAITGLETTGSHSWVAATALALPAAVACRIVFGRPASFPGSARMNTDGRQPSWPRGDDRFGFPTSKLAVEPGWVFAEAAESHRVTEAVVGNGFKLAGEAAGRQMWYHASELSTNEKAGGFAPKAVAGSNGPPLPSFVAADNPNSADLLFRRQMGERWKVNDEAEAAAASEGAQQAAAAAEGFNVKTGKRLQKPAESLVVQSLRKGIAFYQTLQCQDGHFAGDYGGPLFLLPGLVVTWYVTGQLESLISPAKQRAMSAYIRNHQQSDGGWGTHIESPSTMFGSTLNYVALRLLGGAERDDPAAVAGREFIRKHGGALYAASWAKLWLCVLGCMEWEGHNPVPPEMWLLPHWTPFHPGRLWCHCRMVYLPMCFLYGTKFVYSEAQTDPLVLSLRQELYSLEGLSYEEQPWDESRHWVADVDNYSPVHFLMAWSQTLLRHTWERFGGSLLLKLRKKGVEFAVSYMQAEDLQTNFVDIGPVNKVMNMLVCFANEGGSSSANFQKHLLRVPDYLWVAEDGMKMQGYNGSQCWDTAFAMQAIAESGLADEFPLPLRRAYSYFERTQILSTSVSQGTVAFEYEAPEMREKFFRHVSKGGWPFSTSAHGWPISDCTAEGLMAMLALRDFPCIDAWQGKPAMPDERFFDACNVMLSLQNTDGGFATYENNRGYAWFEWLNPSEAFGDIMIDYSYVECTNASIGCLAAFHRAFPHHRQSEVRTAIAKARQFLLNIQRLDGSWYGSWGCCFTYASWFGVEGLLQAGEPFNSLALRKACQFLLKHQNANGGWGEDFSSCFDKTYAPKGMELFGDEQGSGCVNTSWALLALMAAKVEDQESVAAVERGVAYLVRRQDATSGDWPQEGIAGVFNRSCSITYTAYRNVFPIWALGRFAAEFQPHLDRLKKTHK